MQNFLAIALFVALGLLFRRLKPFPPETPQVLNMFALYVSLPALILLKVPLLDFSPEMKVAAILPWGVLAVTTLIVLVAARTLAWSRPTTGVMLLLLPLGNTSFMGVPMVQAFFGEQGFPYLIVYDQVGTMLTFATFGSIILAIYGVGGSVNPVHIARRALLFPPTLALLAGLVLRGWPYPEPLQVFLGNLSHSLTPLVMTAIGFQLRLRQSATVVTPLCFGLALKLLLIPLLALGICRLFGLHGLGVDVAIFEAGMPPMVTAGALAVAAGMQADLAIALVSLGMLCSFATLPLLYAFF